MMECAPETAPEKNRGPEKGRLDPYAFQIDVKF